MARVAVDLPLAHLDRPFDYLVPATMHDDAVPGCRVKVRFAGRDVDGFVLHRLAETDHPGRLAPLRRVVSSEPVLTEAVLRLCRTVADRYAGTLADVLRLAVPPRHARTEAESTQTAPPYRDGPRAAAARELWEGETGGAALLRRLGAGEAPRAVWEAIPGADPLRMLAAAVASTLAAGRGSIVCVPDARDLRPLDRALTDVLGEGRHVLLSADQGPARRYRSFLAAARGQVRVVAGTRAAAFAPVRDLGLVAMWDDGDDSYAEPRAPYPHAREVLLLRAHQESAGVVLGGFARTAEAQMLVESGWAAPVAAPRPRVREAAPQVHVTGETDRDLSHDAAARSTRVPREVFETVRAGLAAGPVLVHVPRGGYQPTLACAACRRPARCAVCTGPLARDRADVSPRCRVCGSVADDWRCPQCAGSRMRVPVVGSLRTAEEWGKAFPSTPVVVSGGDRVLDGVEDRPAVVIATPGAEPRAPDGYAAAVLLDTWLTLGLSSLRAAEEALRRWLAVAALVRPASAGGRVIAVGDPSVSPLQALVRWDPAGYAARELGERRSAGLTPATRMATVTGAVDDVSEALAAAELPDTVQVLGPLDIGEGRSRAVLRIDVRHGPRLTRALQQMQAGRSSRKLPAVRVQVDPTDLA